MVALVWPILVSAVVLFFASFLSWMVLGLHKKDWAKLANEDEVMDAVKGAPADGQSYMFPFCTHAEMQSEAFQAKYKAGPRGVMTILPQVNMGVNLGLTFLYFLAVSFGLAYLAMIAYRPGADFFNVFRFVFAAGFLVFLAAMIPHTIWFRGRITGHVIEAILYAALAGLAFAALWPA